jgi:hypothetical protein
MPPKPGLQAWWRAHVRNHPRLDQDRTDPEGWAGPISGGKHKLYCKKCFDFHIADVQREDAHEVAQGQRANPRDLAQIESYCKLRTSPKIDKAHLDVSVWTLKSATHPSGRGWISSAVTTVLNHLRDCTHVSQDVRSNAVNDTQRSGRGAPDSPSKSRRRRRLENRDGSHPYIPAPPRSTISSTSHHSFPTAAGSSTHRGTELWVNNVQGVDLGQSYFPPSPIISHPPTPNPEFQNMSLPPPSQSFSPTPTELSSNHSYPQPQALPRPYPGSRRASFQHGVDPSLQWSPERQRRFETRVARLTASAGFSLSWVDNVEWIDLCNEFIPAAKSPSRQTLTRRLLPKAADELRSAAKAAVKGHEATLQADGWTGTNTHHLIAYMITVDGKVCNMSF